MQVPGQVQSGIVSSHAMQQSEPCTFNGGTCMAIGNKVQGQCGWCKGKSTTVHKASYMCAKCFPGYRNELAEKNPWQQSKACKCAGFQVSGHLFIIQ